ncbi:MAG: TerC family protein [Bacteroidia bacterium]|nr:TerC family protein [Bacteroidia bacterium]
MSNFWESGIALLMLVSMEVALGIDNVLFVGILSSHLPEAERKRVWRFWMVYSPVLRAALLVGLVQLLMIPYSLFQIGTHVFTVRDVLLLGGGLFLLYKAVKEIHQRLETPEEKPLTRKNASLRATFLQVALIDFVFSADSILTAIGMARSLLIMLVAIVLSLGIMLLAAIPIQRFIQRHPTIKMLALAFLLLIGFTLVGEGTGMHIPKGYIYFAMAFSFGVELLNVRAGLRHSPSRTSAPSSEEIHTG